MSLFYEEKKLVIDACFFVLMTNFPSFLLRRRNGTRPESNDVKSEDLKLEVTIDNLSKNLPLTHIFADFTCIRIFGIHALAKTVYHADHDNFR